MVLDFNGLEVGFDGVGFVLKWLLIEVLDSDGLAFERLDWIL